VPTWMVIGIVIAASVVLAGVGSVIYHRRRSERLKRFRAQPMDAAARERYLDLWKKCQARFVDDPPGAVDDADGLLVQTLRTRGYAADPNKRMAEIAEAFPQYVERYRKACQTLSDDRRSPVSTSNLRMAFLSYRDFFDELVGNYEDELERAS